MIKATVKAAIRACATDTFPFAWMSFKDNSATYLNHYALFSDGTDLSMRINGRAAEPSGDCYVDIYTRIEDDPVIDQIIDAVQADPLVAAKITDVQYIEGDTDWVHYTIQVWW